MNAAKTRIVAGTATLAIANLASCLHAQSLSPSYDYAYNPPNNAAPTGASPHAYYQPLASRCYLGFDAGVALQQDITLRDGVGDSEKITFDPGVRLDGMLGYQFTKRWAAEIEFGIIANQVKHSYALGTDYMSVTYMEFPILVNAIYTLPLNKSKSCSLYFGAGAGGVFTQYTDEYGDQTEGDTVFAYQGQAGFRWAINRQWELGVAYKFLATAEQDVGSGVAYNGHEFVATEFKSDGTMTHSILATLTWRF